MKRVLSFLLCIILTFSFFAFDTKALEDEFFEPYVIDFVLTGDNSLVETSNEETRATGLITSYSLSLSKSGTTLKITGTTSCSPTVVKCAFKDLTVQRRKSSSYSWEEYYDFGNVYEDDYRISLSTSLAVASGYQYRVVCEHYAKKNILTTQTISNTSNIVTV